MIRPLLAAFSFLLVLGHGAHAQNCSVPNTLANGTNADATQVMANFNALLHCLNNQSAPRGYLSGLTLSTAGSSPNFGIAAGIATSNDQTVSMKLSTAYSKSTGAWAVGSGTGSLDSGTIANNTWYHVFLIERVDTGVVDILVSLSATTPTLPANYTKQRRIGSMKTDGTGQWIRFSQIGSTFLWYVSVQNVNSSTIGTTAVSQAVTAPPGIKTKVIMNVAMSAPGAGVGLLVSSLDISDQAVAAGNANVGFTQVAGQVALCKIEEITDVSSQVRMRASAAGSTYWVWTIGWTDVSLALGL
ncbi:hypothetical protein IVB22_00260 [Bradyrhizobium sp. 190]|uniref:hypothetical protein n=1 Tax=Bradyrhizobium sp. 190 TaxID=2782658 RepID=UPI001FF81B77|nr:hypothetical protein [Bradyrhizobium sp. 190]MCK1511030.1 hypothetical protein [Bradyrhizobium sp. 190]